MTYFDEKNNVRAFNFINPEHCWAEGALRVEKQWITLDKNCPYAR